MRASSRWTSGRTSRKASDSGWGIRVDGGRARHWWSRPPISDPTELPLEAAGQHRVFPSNLSACFARSAFESSPRARARRSRSRERRDGLNAERAGSAEPLKGPEKRQIFSTFVSDVVDTPCASTHGRLLGGNQ